MLIKPILPFAEIMITQACNISCAGCTNYSDLSHKGWLSWHDGMQQLIPWLDRVSIPDFGIIGGEPLLNAELKQWIIGLRKLLPDTQLRFTTNGLLLAKNLDIVDLCHNVGNVVFKITKHVDDEKLDNIIDKIKSKFDWEPVTEYGINRWRTSNNLRLQINRPKVFVKTFVGNYEDMRPHCSDAAQAFDICCQQTCPLIYNGKLFKCSTTALLEDVLARFNNPNYREWEPYLKYGIGPDCSDKELTAFINNFGKAHSMCSQCPTEHNTESHLIHFKNVSFKKYA
jgi:organic radical activating enzyme